MTTQKITILATEKANEMIAKGCKLSFDKVLEICVKQITKSQPKAMTLKDVAKMEERNSIIEDGKEFLASGKTVDNSDFYAEASKRQLGSSMRK